MQPDVLLLDEPTANLDPRQEEVFLDLLRHFSGTLICISHDLIFLYDLCDRAVVRDHGRIHHDGTLREMISQRQSLRKHGLDISFRLAVSTGMPDLPVTAPMDAFHGPSPPSDKFKDKPLVFMRDYHYRYLDGTLALCGIDLRIHEGERISIVGENGAGKTTLLSCLLGLREESGTFRFVGRPVTCRQRKALWRQVGIVFQDCADQLFCPSVLEEIVFELHQIGYSQAECRERIGEALSLVRLEGFEARVPLPLSGGEPKRLALACVLAMKPTLLILDEPTAVLDPQGGELLLEILENLNATLLLVSHDIFFVGALTHRALVMHHGQIIEDLLIHAFLQDERLGNLNGLSYLYRQHSSNAIRMLQHEHEHSHFHQHLHTNPHRHGEAGHEHLHAHEHSHRFTHSHLRNQEKHDHNHQKDLKRQPMKKPLGTNL